MILHKDFIYIEGKIPYYQSRLLKEAGVKHAFFTREGGVSQGEFSSLNFATGNGEITDSVENVYKNHEIAASVFGLKVENVCRSVQTHTTNVALVGEEDKGRGLIKPEFADGTDGLVTTEKDIILSVRSADCVPVLLCDKASGVCAAVHAGWRGTVGGITKNAVELMIKQGAKIENILAAIGPCIGKCCYEVGEELYKEFLSKSPNYKEFFTPVGEKYILDLNLANETILQEAGIKPQNISVADICTKCNEKHFFSHRRQGAVRGTMSACICL